MPQLTKQQWFEVIILHREKGIRESVEIYQKYRKSNLISKKQIKDLKHRIRQKTKLVDNIGMKALISKTGLKATGRPKNKKKRKHKISDLIDILNEEQKREIIQDWIEEQSEKGNQEKIDKYKKMKTFSKSLFAKLLNFCRTSIYKSPKTRKYKYEQFHDEIIESFNKNQKRYGRERLAKDLINTYQININERTLGHYMNRLGLKVIQRTRMKKSECKTTKVHYPDLVKRDFWPEKDNIVACDISYIPHKNNYGNHAYLSIAISHHTKMIESWKLSLYHDQKLVTNTLKPLKTRKNLIIHSDHGTQYSSYETQRIVANLNAKTSMSRIGNSLDNRVAEYFFRTIKSECLNHIDTYKMSFEELNNYIKDYVEWYNEKRIQKRLHWQTPSQVSQYAV